LRVSIAPRCLGLSLVLAAAACGPEASTPKATVPPAEGRTATGGDSAFALMPPVQPGDWLAEHREDGEDFAAYVRGNPRRADPGAVLAFLPVGDLAAEPRACFDAAVAFAGIWFDLGTRELPSAALTTAPALVRKRTGGPPGARRQVCTRWFLDDLLPKAKPDDAVVLVGVTMADLYPDPDWNFVFGEADLVRGVGVYSLARYFPEFYGAKRGPDAGRLTLLRTLKVVVHETGHAFGLVHCVRWTCVMNGSNSLEEADRRPPRLCPDCLEKLRWNRGFDVRRRYLRLATFLRAHGLADEAAWNEARAAAPR
jgi:archaemetzincin